MHGAHEDIAARQAHSEAKHGKGNELGSAHSLPGLEHASELPPASASAAPWQLTLPTLRLRCARGGNSQHCGKPELLYPAVA